MFGVCESDLREHVDGVEHQHVNEHECDDIEHEHHGAQ